MKPAVSLSNTSFISITEERQKAQKCQMKMSWLCSFLMLGNFAETQLRTSQILLSESPQLSTSTLDLLTELCLASFKEVPLFKQFLLPGDYEKEAIDPKINMNLQIFINFFPPDICNRIPHVTLFPLRGTFRHSPSASTHFPLSFCKSSGNAVLLCSRLIQTDLYSQMCQTVHGEVSQHRSNLFKMKPILE